MKAREILRATRRRVVRPATLSVSLLLAGAAVAGTGCSLFSGDENEDSPGQAGDGDACTTTRQLFAERVWPQIMAKSCINCHAPGGLAAQRYSSLALYPAAYPGFLDENLQVLRELAKTEYEDVSVLLRKPSGELEHGGGVQFEPGSDEHRLMSELVQRLREQDDCQTSTGDEPSVPVTLLDASATFRKASLLLAGKLPDGAAQARLDEEGDAALPQLLDGLLSDPGFKDWLLLTFNDLLLTDRYLGDATNTLRREDFPNIEVYLADDVPDEEKRAYRRSVAREPLELIAYIVQNDRPFTEVVTADYTILNGYSARIYNEYGITFADPENEGELQPGKIHALREGVDLVFPHAGVLSSPMFLNRFPTSPTNRNRHRARMVLQKFLATDILKVGERPIDPTQSVTFANPTREDPSCSVCHSVLDPIAGAFMKFSDNDAEQFLPDRQWHSEMVLPGFGDEQMQVSDYARSLPWLGERIARDPRFPLAVVYNTFQALTGQKPLVYPSDGDSGAVAAWQAQDALFRRVAAQLVESGYNYKTVVRELILSPYFRAQNASDETVNSRGAELAAYGTARLSSPENLVRKLRAVVGFDWVRYDRQPALTTTYDILYGGIDSDAVTERLAEPNGVMSAVMSRMANEVACRATAWDFMQPAEQRLLFPHVNPTDLPSSPEGMAAIRRNLQHLHERLWGERLNDDAAELELTLGLWQSTLEEGQAKMTAEELDEWLPWDCRGRWNRVTGEELPEGERQEKDPDYTQRAWMAVLTYLLSDYRFLYE